MRIVSLLPSATEIVCALGLEEFLVGVSHECDWPRSVTEKPKVTSSVLPAPQTDEDGNVLEPTAAAIDAAVRASVAAGESLYRVDVDLLRSLNPTILLTQGLCDVCAVSHKIAVAAADAMGSAATVIDLAPTTLAGVLESFRQVGTATGRDAEAAELSARTQARWDAVQEKATKAKAAGGSPRILLLEWPDPLFSAGHWNPELLTLAGGTGGAWDKVGEDSKTLDWETVREFAPEFIVLIACGFDAYRALEEAWPLSELPGWYDLPAVRNGECYAADGSAYFNRPGPRLAESAEILATILRPEIFTEMLPPYAVQRFSDEMLTQS